MNRLVFEKTGSAVYISHLDLIRIFQRCFRRAGMLLKHSQGFTPHAYVSIMLPLPVGMSSRCEIIDFELDESDKTPLEQVPELLNRTMPAGIRVLQFYQSDRKPKELAYLRAKLTLEYDNGVTDACVDAISKLLAQDEILLEKQTKSGNLTEQNIKQMLPEYQLVREENTLTIECVVCAQNPSLNPMQLSRAIAKYLPEFAPDFASCERLQLLDKDGKPFA